MGEAVEAEGGRGLVVDEMLQNCEQCRGAGLVCAVEAVVGCRRDEGGVVRGLADRDHGGAAHRHRDGEDLLAF